MISSDPIGYLGERPIYDNAPTVVAVIASLKPDEVILVRRDNEPGRGLLGLPGGYHMRGETWQEAGCRELLEETGYSFDHSGMKIWSYATDEYGNNLLVATNSLLISSGASRDSEAQEVLVAWELPDLHEWAFPRHYHALRTYYESLA